LVQCRTRKPTKGLNGEALATFGAASADDGTAGTRFHANQKTMGALATSDRRLECTFHGFYRAKKIGIQRAALADFRGVSVGFQCFSGRLACLNRCKPFYADLQKIAKAHYFNRL